MSNRFSTIRFAVICTLLLLGPGIAQDKTSQQDEAKPNPTPNLVHDRHTHHHNKPHTTVTPTKQRFYTTRASQVMLPLPNEEDAFVFAVFGDRTGGPESGVNILADAVRDVNLIEPDLVMTVGDLINGYNRTPEWLTQMKEFKTIMGELLCPWFPVAGNHDVYWRPLNDPNILPGQHDKHYEMHFGPLWYSFQHKDCNFIVLYSDEGDPKTGQKTFSKPEAQKISEEQLAFLKESLKRGEKNQHQFIFLHHPRWLGRGYGDDWKKRVHPLLKQTGNVTAVFAGHIHYMRYDPEDGIEYVTLATVGGGQSGKVPKAGYLHQYHLVTVRPKQVAMAAFPVGEAMNVREITGDLLKQADLLAKQAPKIEGKILITEEGPQQSVVKATVSNPSDRPIDFTLTPSSADSRWSISPNHTHGHLEPGETTTSTFRISYRAPGVDDSFRPVEFVLAQDYLARTTRYRIPETRTAAEYEIKMTVSSTEVPNRALTLDGKNDSVKVASSALKLPQGPFTFEAWFNAKSFSNRVGFIAKTENSEFGIFMSDGKPSADVHLGGRYRTAKSNTVLPTNRWMHIAAVQNDNTLTLFVDGKQVDQVEIDPSWKRTTNKLPFYIGADTSGSGEAMSFYHGQIDEVRITSKAIYTDDFTPERRLTALDDSVLMMNFDQTVGPFHVDSSKNQAHSQAFGGAKLTTPTP